MIISGGLWLIVWRRPWRLFGLVVISAGIALTSIHDRVDIFIDRDAKVVAVRGKDGKLQAPKSRRAFYTIAQWLKAGGDERQPKEASVGAGWQCDAYSCVTLVKGKTRQFHRKARCDPRGLRARRDPHRADGHPPAVPGAKNYLGPRRALGARLGHDRDFRRRAYPAYGVGTARCAPMVACAPPPGGHPARTGDCGAGRGENRRGRSRVKPWLGGGLQRQG